MSQFKYLILIFFITFILGLIYFFCIKFNNLFKLIYIFFCTFFISFIGYLYNYFIFNEYVVLDILYAVYVSYIVKVSVKRKFK